MPSKNFAKSVKGTAGVHLVVAELSLKGYVALPTTRNLKSVDVVVFNEDLTRHAFLQVKSTDKPQGGWLVGRVGDSEDWEQELLSSISLGKRFFYVFVSLPSARQAEPSFYIVPSADVARWVTCDLKRYLCGKDGRKAANQLWIWAYDRKRAEVTAMLKRYQGKWDILKLHPNSNEPSMKTLTTGR